MRLTKKMAWRPGNEANKKNGAEAWERGYYKLAWRPGNEATINWRGGLGMRLTKAGAETWERDWRGGLGTSLS